MDRAKKKWLEQFPDRELYRAYAPGLKGNIVTSQGGASALYVHERSLANKIRRVEPMSMLKLNAEAQYCKFYTVKVLHSVP